MTEPTNETGQPEPPAAQTPEPFLHTARAAGLFVPAAFLVAIWLQASCGGITDADALYHFRQAAEFLRRGFASPVTAFSYCAIGHLRADIWFGFHVFLAPFTRLANPLFGLQAATVVELTLALVLLYVAVRRLQLPYPWLWPFFLVLFSPTAAHVVLKARPQVLSAGLAPLLLSLLITGPTWGVFLVAAALTWLHPSFLWVIPLLAVLVLVVKGLCERAWEWRGAVASLLGILLGLLARPQPWAAAKLQYLQLVALQVARGQHLPIDFGAELDRLPLSPASVTAHPNAPTLVSSFLLTPVLWVLAVAVGVAALTHRAELSPRRRTALWSTFLCAAGFFAMTMGMTYRAVPLWTAFTALSLGTLLGYFVLSPEAGRGRWCSEEIRKLIAAGLLIFTVVLGWHVLNEYAIKGTWREPRTSHLQEAGLWLRDHSEPGDLVANVSWDTFRELYFWSPENRYLYGMDPIFLYAQNPRLFWKVRHLNDKASAFTTDGPAFPEGHRVDTYSFLHDELRARYVFLQAARLPALDVYLASDPRFAIRYTDPDVRLYEVLPSPSR